MVAGGLAAAKTSIGAPAISTAAVDADAVNTSRRNNCTFGTASRLVEASRRRELSVGIIIWNASIVIGS
jgi:hypothetical protein